MCSVGFRLVMVGHSEFWWVIVGSGGFMLVMVGHSVFWWVIVDYGGS